MRQAAKIDICQPEIVEALRKCGILVIILSGVGRGCPDLLWHNGYTHMMGLIDCKSEHGRLTKKQKELWALWPVDICKTAEQALRIVGAVVQESEI
jgi:hypothetical protein